MAVQTITEYKMLIDGEWAEASSGEWVDVRNPATGELTGVAEKGWHYTIFGDAKE